MQLRVSASWSEELRDLENFVTSQLRPVGRFGGRRVQNGAETCRDVSTEVCTVDDQRHCSAAEKSLIKDFQMKLDGSVQAAVQRRLSCRVFVGHCSSSGHAT